MRALYSRLRKYGGSLLTRIKYPQKYETGVLTLLWYTCLERIRSYFRPSWVIALPFEKCELGLEAPSKDMAVIIHCYYIDLFGELLTYVKNIPFSYYLFISTDTHEKKVTIVEQLRLAGFKNYEVRVVENRGRDIGPKLIAFRDVYLDHRYFLHLHTKKSPYLGQWGTDWRTYLLSNLLGSPEIISNIYSILSQPEIGLVFPEPFEFNTPQLRWDNNFEKASYLAQRMKIPISKTYCPHFPVGSMFWGKTQAIQPLLDLNLRWDDFVDEKNHLDGQLEHAIERLVGLVANAQGLYGQRVSIQKKGKYLKITNREQLSAIIRQAHHDDRS